MRRKDKEIGDRSEMEAILNKGELCHIGLLDDKGVYVTPVNFGYRDGAIYFHSATGGRKIEAIKKDGRVSFCVYSDHQVLPGENACKFTAAYRSVMGTGKAEIVNDPEEKKRGLESVMRHYGSDKNDFNENILTVTAVVKITIETMTGKKSKV